MTKKRILLAKNRKTYDVGHLWVVGDEAYSKTYGIMLDAARAIYMKLGEIGNKDVWYLLPRNWYGKKREQYIKG